MPAPKTSETDDEPRVFRLPDLGEGLEEAELVAWHVAVGDHIVADQPLAAVETDKAIVEAPAPWSGVVVELFAAPGDIVKVGAPLVAIGRGGDDAGAIVGELEAEPPEPTKSKSAKSTPPNSEPAGPTPSAAAGARPLAAPAARALARRLGVDLARVRPTGVAGQATLADVERAAASSAPAASDDEAPLRGPRRAMARAMARARDRVAPATVTDLADVDAWAKPEADVTFRLIRAVAQAVAAEPALNAWFDDAAETVRRHSRLDLGLAVDTPDGLFVPVLRDVGRMDAPAIAAERARLLAAIRTRRATPADLREPTITLSNFGMLAGRHAELVVAPPQVAILGAGRIGPAWVERQGAAAVARCLPLSLTFDHRVVTGGEAARFLRAVIDDLERDS